MTKEDKEKYEEIILQKYEIPLKEISSNFIGGCMIENDTQGIFIDNTLFNKIEEKLKG